MASPLVPPLPPYMGRRKRKCVNNGLTHYPLILNTSHMINYVNIINKKGREFRRLCIQRANEAEETLYTESRGAQERLCIQKAEEHRGLSIQKAGSSGDFVY